MLGDDGDKMIKYENRSEQIVILRCDVLDIDSAEHVEVLLMAHQPV